MGGMNPLNPGKRPTSVGQPEKYPTIKQGNSLLWPTEFPVIAIKFPVMILPKRT